MEREKLLLMGVRALLQSTIKYSTWRNMALQMLRDCEKDYKNFEEEIYMTA